MWAVWGVWLHVIFVWENGVDSWVSEDSSTEDRPHPEGEDRRLLGLKLCSIHKDKIDSWQRNRSMS